MRLCIFYRNLSEEWRMPLLVSDQCVRAICFDRLREMFDSEVPFSRPEKEIGWHFWFLSYMPD